MRPSLSALACPVESFYFPAMNLIKERSRAEIILFAVIIFGVWLSIWAVILVSSFLEVTSLIIALGGLIGFALLDSDSE
jgi:nitrate reductase NapE component